MYNLISYSMLFEPRNCLFSVCVPGYNKLVDGSCSKYKKSGIYIREEINVQIVADEMLSLQV